MTTSEHTVGTVDVGTNLFAVSGQAYSPLECTIEHVYRGAARPSRLISDLTAQSQFPKTRLYQTLLGYVGRRQLRQDDSRMTAGSQ